MVKTLTAQAMAARGVALSIETILRNTAKVTLSVVDEMRASLAAFDQDAALCLERKALPDGRRLDLLLRYEATASRNLSRMLAEYRSLRVESSGFKVTISCVLPA